MRILMVCLGNICRSPLAEGILKGKIEKENLKWVIESAGTNGLHNGEAPHYLSQKIANINGFNISKQISRKFTVDDFENFDLIFALAMDVKKEIEKVAKTKQQTKKVHLFLDVAFPSKGLDVPDPWFGGEEGYHEVFKLIDEGCKGIIEKYKI